MRRSIWFEHESASEPNWSTIIDILKERHNIDLSNLKSFIERLKRIEEIMHNSAVDSFIIDKRLPIIVAELAKLTRIE